MNPRVSTTRLTRAGWAAALCAAAAALLGVLGLAGWSIGAPLLTRVSPMYRPIALTAACSLVLLGLALAAGTSRETSRPVRRAAGAVALVLSLYGLLEMAGFVVDAHLDVEEALTRALARAWSRPFEAMSPAAGVLVFLVGAALLMLLWRPAADTEPRSRRWGDMAGGLGATAAAAALVFALSYVYGAPLLYHYTTLSVALPTVLGLLLLGVGVVAAAGAEHWPLRPFSGTSVRAQLLRAFVPLTFLVVIAGLVVWAQVPALEQVNLAFQGAVLAVIVALAAGLAASRMAGSLGAAIEHARAAERESEEQYRNLVTASPDGIVVHRDGQVLFANPAALALYGAESFAQLASHDLIEELIPHGERHIAVGQARQVMAGQHPPLREGHIVRLDGQEAPIEAISSRVEYEGERAVQTMYRDVAKRVQAEQERERVLAEMEKWRSFLDAVLKQMPAGVIVLEAPSGRVILANEEMAHIWRHPAHDSHTMEEYREWQGRHPDDGRPYRPEEWPGTRSMQYGETVVEEEVLFLRGDETPGAMLVSSRPIQNAKGETIAVVVVNTDITEQRQAEQERGRQTRLLGIIQESVPEILLYLDRDFHLLHANSAAEEFSGHPREQLLGRSALHLFPDAAEVPALLHRVRDTGEAVQLHEFTSRVPGREDLGLRSFETTVTPVTTGAGEVEGLVVSITDITDRVEQREQVLASERARAELAEHLNDEIAHRVKNNLAMISGLLRMQAIRQPDPVLVEALHDAMARVRTFANVHEQMYQGQSDRVDLLTAVRRIAETNQEVFAGAQAVRISTEGSSVWCHSRVATNLSVIANELITNALKHGKPGADGVRRVEARVAEEQGRLVLEVWNSGNPVPEGFDPAAEAAMGLLLVLELVVEQYDGSFTLTPERGGTLARVVLDLGEASRQTLPLAA